MKKSLPKEASLTASAHSYVPICWPHSSMESQGCCCLSLPHEEGIAKLDTFWEKFVFQGSRIVFLIIYSAGCHTRMIKNVLMLKFEDMKKGLHKAVLQVSSFMDTSLSSEKITKIIDLCSFEKMRKDNTANWPWIKEFCDEDRNPIMIRKGIVGD